MFTVQISFFDDESVEYMVRDIPKIESHNFILTKHYAKRLPCISYAFGLLRFGELVGVCTFGIPVSSTLLRGVCGSKYADQVLELNRLVLKHNLPNEASRLVAGSLRLLPKPKIIVSYADTAQTHIGFVYQACNFFYTGLSAKFLDPVVKGLEHHHHAAYDYGLTNAQLIQKYGKENVTFIERSRKHRYIIFTGSKSQKKEFRKNLKYAILPYPKGLS